MLSKEQIEEYRRELIDSSTDEHHDAFNELCDLALKSLQPEVAATKPEVRNNQDGSLDEVVGHRVSVHLEQMDRTQWFLEIYPQQGIGYAVWLTSRARIKASIEGRYYGSSLPQRNEE